MNFIDAFLEEINSHHDDEARKEVGEFYLDDDSISLEGNIGQFGKSTNGEEFHVDIYSHEGDNLPHLHITKGKSIDCCIRLDVAEYFPHGKHTSAVNGRTIRKFIAFLNKKNPRYEMSNYKVAILLWNENNLHIQLDENRKMPNYKYINDHLSRMHREGKKSWKKCKIKN